MGDERRNVVHRWHGLIDGASDDGIPAAYTVTLEGTPLDADDVARVHARLSDPHWRAQQVRDALVDGVRLGAGQLWRPDRRARVDVLRAERGAGSARVVLAVNTVLDRTALHLRLLQLFADDRLIEPTVRPRDE